MRVDQIMSQPAIFCRAHDTLDVAAELMWQYDCGAIPIKGDDDRTIGIVTDRDVCMAAHMEGKALHEIPVEGPMATKVLSCKPDDSIEDAERLMSENQVRRLPVIDSAGELAGVLSIGDIARAYGESRKKTPIRQLVKTLAAICTPHGQSLVARSPAPTAHSSAP